MTPDRRLPLLTALLALAAVAACGGEKPSAPGPTPPSIRTAASPGKSASPCADARSGPEPDAATLRAFVRKRSRELRDCYQRSLKRDDSAGGKATFRFTIGTCGDLSGIEVAARRGRVDEAAACAARAMRGWKTPFRPAEPVTVEYPVAFSSSM